MMDYKKAWSTLKAESGDRILSGRCTLQEPEPLADKMASIEQRWADYPNWLHTEYRLTFSDIREVKDRMCSICPQGTNCQMEIKEGCGVILIAILDKQIEEVLS